MKKYEITEKLKALRYDPKEYWVVAGAAMVLHGIKEESSDLDLGCTTELADRLEESGSLFQVTPDGNRWFRMSGGIEVFENWLYDGIVDIEGIPVISLRGLLTMKERLGREKDKKDVELIRGFLDK